MKKVISLLTAIITAVLLTACVTVEKTSGTADAPSTQGSADASGTTSGAAETSNTTEAHIHSFGEWETVTESTCQKEGEAVRLCSCGYEERKTMERHTIVTEKGLASTETEPGITDKKTCSVCGEVIQNHDFLPPLESGKLGYTVTSTNTCSIKNIGTHSGDVLFIPPEIDGYKVTAIGRSALHDLNVKEVFIPSTVETIEYGAFEFSTVQKVNFSSGLKNIGVYAFHYCSYLTSITLPETVVKIEDGAFTGCFGLSEVINNSSLNIAVGTRDHGNVALYALGITKSESKLIKQGDFLFFQNSDGMHLVKYLGSDKIVTLPDRFQGEIYKIHDLAFFGKITVESVVIPEGITHVGYKAFELCTSLQSITIPSTLTEFSDSAFSSCYKLQSFAFPDGTKIIPEGILFGCTELKTVVIPASVEEIGVSAFGSCKSLCEVTIPDGITEINENTFVSCESLETVYLPESVKSIWDSAFRGCKAIKRVEYAGTKDQWYSHVYKGAYWGYNSQVYCTDGKLY